MTLGNLKTRNLMVGLALSLAVAAGVSACGGSTSTKTTPGVPAANTPASTTPTTIATSGGGVSY